MKYQEIEAASTELVNSFASMEVETKWDQFVKMQNELAATPISQLLNFPEYAVTIFAGHVLFNDDQFIKKLKARLCESIDWPESDLEEHLLNMSERKVSAIAKSRIQKWQEIKKIAPSLAVITIFVTHSLAKNPKTSTFLKNLKS